MHVLRERLTNGYFTKPAYMLSLMVNEFTKPAHERAEWLVWMGPDLVLLNPEIPLELFLPPSDFSHIHFIATHDAEGVNLGVYFLRVHQWSTRFLIEVLAYPSEWLGDAREKDEVAFEMVASSDGYREHTQFQPRRWYNAYQLSTTDWEGQAGDLAVHFHDLEGDKWNAMSRVLTRLSPRGENPFRVPLAATAYEREVDEYWERLRFARDAFPKAEAHLENEEVLNMVRRLQYTASFEADDAIFMRDALERLYAALDEDVKIP